MSVCTETHDPINDVFWTLFVYLRVCEFTQPLLILLQKQAQSQNLYMGDDKATAD